MHNLRIALLLDETADLLEFQGANAFRVRAYRNGARTIREYGDSISRIVEEDPDKLKQIPEIGDNLAKYCVEIVTTGAFSMRDKLLETTPHTVLDLLRVPRLGPKKAAVLFNELGIRDLTMLKAACEAGEVQKLKGFGAKTEQDLLAGIAIASAANERLRWDQADELVESIRKHLQDLPSVRRLESAGSYRRGRDTIGDLDFLAVADDPKEAMDQLEAYPLKAETTARGETKCSIRLTNGFQVDLRVVPERSFGAALQYFTGSKEHNVVLRGLAKDRGLKINEWGVFRVGEGGAEESLAGENEADVYAAVGLPWFPPELREGRREYDWAKAGELPRLIEVGDLRGDLHMHTTATDGRNTLEEMIAAAKARGYSYIAITDHSQRVSMARGLDPVRLRQQWAEIDRINAQATDGFRVLKGIECDILEAGGMDLPDDVLAEADWVNASIHYGQTQSSEQLTARIVGALKHPSVCVVAHPTGRVLNARPSYELDMDAVFDAAVKNKKFLELNASPERLDLSDLHCAAAKQRGIPIVISTDAHKIATLENVRYGIIQARRAGLTAPDVVNTRSWEEIRTMLGRA